MPTARRRRQKARMDDETIARADALFAGDAARGPRYPAPVQAQIDTELLSEEEPTSL